MRKLVDVLLGLAVLAMLLAVGFRFLSPDMGFSLAASFVTPLFLWRGAMGLLTIAAVLVLRQIRDEVADSSKPSQSVASVPSRGV